MGFELDHEQISWHLIGSTGNKSVMRPVQPIPILPEPIKPAWEDIAWLPAFTIRALTELISARVEFANLKTTDILARNQTFKGLEDRPAKDRPLLVRRIAFVLPRLSARLPWRSDCLVQAIAAQNWLASYDLYGQIQVGVEHPGGGQFGAHAWVLHRDTIVTGGQINRYSVLLDDSHRFKPTESDKAGRRGE